MTNKAYAETLKNCASMLADGIKYMKEEHKKQFREAYEKAIEALSVEPQGDLISREAIKELFKKKCVGECECCSNYNDDDECGLLDELPPVEPQEWISPTAEPVSTEEAKKLLYQEFKGKMKDGNPRLLVAYEIAMKALETQTEWIPVSSGNLPEEHQECLFWDEILELGYGSYFTTSRGFKCFWDDGRGCDAKNVVAWRPLPEPYKEEEK